MVSSILPKSERKKIICEEIQLLGRKQEGNYFDEVVYWSIQCQNTEIRLCQAIR